MDSGYRDPLMVSLVLLSGWEIASPQVLPEQLQPSIGHERGVREFQLKIPIDACAQIVSASSNVRWPSVVGVKGWLAPSSNHDERPFLIQKCESTSGKA